MSEERPLGTPLQARQTHESFFSPATQTPTSPFPSPASPAVRVGPPPSATPLQTHQSFNSFFTPTPNSTLTGSPLSLPRGRRRNSITEEEEALRDQLVRDNARLAANRRKRHQRVVIKIAKDEVSTSLESTKWICDACQTELSADRGIVKTHFGSRRCREARRKLGLPPVDSDMSDITSFSAIASPDLEVLRSSTSALSPIAPLSPSSHTSAACSGTMQPAFPGAPDYVPRRHALGDRTNLGSPSISKSVDPTRATASRLPPPHFPLSVTSAPTRRSCSGQKITLHPDINLKDDYTVDLSRWQTVITPTEPPQLVVRSVLCLGRVPSRTIACVECSKLVFVPALLALREAPVQDVAPGAVFANLTRGQAIRLGKRKSEEIGGYQREARDHQESLDRANKRVTAWKSLVIKIANSRFLRVPQIVRSMLERRYPAGPDAIKTQIDKADAGDYRLRRWSAAAWWFAMLIYSYGGRRTAKAASVSEGLPGVRVLQKYSTNFRLQSNKGVPTHAENWTNFKVLGLFEPGDDSAPTPPVPPASTLEPDPSLSVTSPRAPSEPAPTPLVPPASTSNLLNRSLPPTSTPTPHKPLYAVPPPSDFARPADVFKRKRPNAGVSHKVGISIIMDEIAIEEGPCFDEAVGAGGEVRGVARESMPASQSMTIDSEEEMEEVSKFLGGPIRYASEATVVAIQFLVKGVTSCLPFVFSGTDKTRTVAQEEEMISGLIDSVGLAAKEMGDAEVWSVGTDGDNKRRKALHAITLKKKVSWGDRLWGLLGKLKGLCLLCGKDEETVDYDLRHLLKRFGTLLRRPPGVSVFDRKVTPMIILSQLRLFLPRVALATLIILLFPDDRQNVSKACHLLLTISSLPPPPADWNPTLKSSRFALNFLGKIFELILTPYIDPTLSLSQQVESLLTAAFLLFALRHTGANHSVNWELYHDFQSTIKNIIFCLAKAKLCSADYEFFISQFGSNSLEALFGIIRTLSNDSTVTAASLPRKAGRALMITRIQEDYPDWTLEDRRLDFSTPRALDEARPRDETGSRRVGDVDLDEIWASALKSAQAILDSNPVSKGKVELEELLLTAGIDLLSPHGDGHIGANHLNGGVDEANDEVDESITTLESLTETEVVSHPCAEELGLAGSPEIGQEEELPTLPSLLVPFFDSPSLSTPETAQGVDEQDTSSLERETSDVDRHFEDEDGGEMEAEMDMDDPWEDEETEPDPQASANKLNRTHTTLGNGRQLRKAAWCRIIKDGKVNVKKSKERMRRAAGYANGGSRNANKSIASTTSHVLNPTEINDSDWITESTTIAFLLSSENRPSLALGSIMTLGHEGGLTDAIPAERQGDSGVRFSTRVMHLSPCSEEIWKVESLGADGEAVLVEQTSPAGWEFTEAFVNFGLPGRTFPISGADFEVVTSAVVGIKADQTERVRYSAKSLEEIFARLIASAESLRKTIKKVPGKSSLFPYGTNDATAPAPSQTSASTSTTQSLLNLPAAPIQMLQCPVPNCPAQLFIKDARHHLSLHNIVTSVPALEQHPDLKDTGMKAFPGLPPNSCGFCGGINCSTSLSYTTRKEPKFDTNCKWQPSKSMSYAAASKSSKDAPSTNVIITCERCQTNIWKVNTRHHYSNLHLETNGILTPAEALLFSVFDQEVEWGIAKEKKRAAKQVKDAIKASLR
ncbi:hypothetical protein P7C70_g2722, partial [Phenoliferia sp. Uapishka_3]